MSENTNILNIIDNMEENTSLNCKIEDIINFNFEDCNNYGLKERYFIILNRIKVYCENHINYKTDDNVYIKLNRGNTSSLRSIYFNITKFIENRVGEILLFSGAGQNKFDNCTYMSIKCDNNTNYILKGTNLYNNYTTKLLI